MKTKLTQKRIAEMAGVTPAHVSLILKKERIPSPRLAKKLEKITGVKSMVWLYPEDNPNPLLKDNSKLTKSK